MSSSALLPARKPLQRACETARQAAIDGPVYEPDAPVVVGAGAAQPPSVARSLSTQLFNEDALEDALMEADVPTLRTLKGVSTAWRARPR